MRRPTAGVAMLCWLAWPLAMASGTPLGGLGTPPPAAEAGGARLQARDGRGADLEAAGRAAFLAQGCNRCHGIEALDIEATTGSVRMRGPDLSTTGRDRAASWIAAYLEREETIDDVRHRVPFRGDDEELQAIAAWLATLR